MGNLFNFGIRSREVALYREISHRKPQDYNGKGEGNVSISILIPMPGLVVEEVCLLNLPIDHIRMPASLDQLHSQCIFIYASSVHLDPNLFVAARKSSSHTYSNHIRSAMDRPAYWAHNFSL